jgi:hypothetical protein
MVKAIRVLAVLSLLFLSSNPPQRNFAQPEVPRPIISKHTAQEGWITVGIIDRVDEIKNSEKWKTLE